MLVCISEPGTPYSCCDRPYIWLTSDCVRACLIDALTPWTSAAVGPIEGAIRFGNVPVLQQWQDRLQDIQALINRLHRMFLAYVRDVANGEDLGQASYWTAWDMDCIVLRLKCRYGLDVRPFALLAGFYDPLVPPADTVLATLPLPYDVPCGDPVPDPPPVPPLYPPSAVDCTPMLQVDLVVDVFDESGADNSGNVDYLIAYNSFAIAPGNGPFSDNVGNILRGDGLGGWIVIPISDGDTIGATLDPYLNITLWVHNAGFTTPYYPLVFGTLVNTTLTLDTYLLPTNGHDVISRDVLVEVSTDDGATWQPVYQGPEIVLGDQDILAVPAGSTLARITYLGQCPGTFDIEVTDNTIGPRSFLLASASTNGNVVQTNFVPGMTVALAKQGWSFGSWVKWNATPWGNANSQWGIQLGRGIDPSNTYQWSIGLVRLATNFGGRIYLELFVNLIDGGGPGINSPVYQRSISVDGLETALDADWHSIVVVKDGAPYRFDLTDFTVYVDVTPAGLTLEASTGVYTDYNHGLIDPSFGEVLNLGLAKGVGLTVNPSYFKDAFYAERALTQAEITNVVMTGNWAGNEAALQVKCLWRADLPDVLNAPPYIGSNLPGGLIGSAPSGVVFSPDIPPNPPMLFP